MPARILSQDLFAFGSGPLITYAYPAVDGVFKGRSAMPLKNHSQSHFQSGQTVIDQRKATGSSYRKAGVGFEFQQGHKVPMTTWEFDVTAHNMINILRSFFGTSAERFHDNTAGYVASSYFAQFRPYTASEPDRFLTLYRKLSDSSANSHRISGAVPRTLNFSGSENNTFACTTEMVGKDVEYDVNWGTYTGARNNSAFDTTFDPLLWKNAYFAIGHVYEPPAGVTVALSGNTLTFVGVDIQLHLEPGAMLVLNDSTTQFGPIDSIDSATQATLQTGTWTGFSARGAFKVINFINIPSISLDLTNNLISKAYNNPTVEKHLYGDLTGSGTLTIPFSEINPSGDSGAISPGYTGSEWLKFFLNGGTVKCWLWWGHPYDCVLDCKDDGDFGIAFLIRPTSDDFTDADGEMGVNVDFQIVGTDYSTGLVTTKVYAAAQLETSSAIGTGVDFIALGSDVLAANPDVAVYRGDIITVFSNTASSTGEVRYVARPDYLYTYFSIGTFATTDAGAGYKIESPAVIIQAGYGNTWKVPGANGNPETLS